METLEIIGQEIIECKNAGESIYKEHFTEQEVVDRLLDDIIELNTFINMVNDCYLQLFPMMDNISKLEVENDKDADALDEVLSGLNDFNRLISKLFSKLSKSELYQNGCKTTLGDLRSNIRTLREYLEDTEERFFLNEDDAEMDELLADLM